MLRWIWLGGMVVWAVAQLFFLNRIMSLAGPDTPRPLSDRGRFRLMFWVWLNAAVGLVLTQFSRLVL